METDSTGNVSWNLLITFYRVNSCSHSMVATINYLTKGGDFDSQSTQL